MLMVMPTKTTHNDGDYGDGDDDDDDDEGDVDNSGDEARDCTDDAHNGSPNAYGIW